MWRERRQRCLIIILALMLVVRAAAATEAVRVSSKIDTEGALLGNIILLVLQQHGVQTMDKIQLGTTQVVRQALIAGAIDIYPEYTGNGAFFFHQEQSPVWKQAKAGYLRVKQHDQQENGLRWLTPAAANNSWTIAIQQALAKKYQLKTLSDLRRYLHAGGKFKLAASAEFIESPGALPAFEKAYGFRLAQNQLLSLAGGDTTVTIKAAAQNISGVNAAMAYTTDGPLAALGLVTLEDDRHALPIYAPTPVIRQAVLARWPAIEQWLAPVFKQLDNRTLQRLNAQIAVEGYDPASVARQFLHARNLL